MISCANRLKRFAQFFYGAIHQNLQTCARYGIFKKNMLRYIYEQDR